MSETISMLKQLMQELAKDKEATRELAKSFFEVADEVCGVAAPYLDKLFMVDVISLIDL